MHRARTGQVIGLSQKVFIPCDGLFTKRNKPARRAGSQKKKVGFPFAFILKQPETAHCRGLQLRNGGMTMNIEETMARLKELINGPEAENTRERYFGKYFTGSIQLQIGDERYTMHFHEGTMLTIQKGPVMNGFSFGLAGARENWEDFFTRGIFGFATAPAYQNPLGLTVTGSVLQFRQNYNLCAHVCKQLARLCSGKEAS